MSFIFTYFTFMAAINTPFWFRQTVLDIELEATAELQERILLQH